MNTRTLTVAAPSIQKNARSAENLSRTCASQSCQRSTVFGGGKLTREVTRDSIATPFGETLQRSALRLAGAPPTRAIVSRVLKEFERKGAIRLSRAHIVLVDEHIEAGHRSQRIRTNLTV